jgi:NADPH:quinone reductase-like Zn-dependent oxidoreductase
MSVDTATTVRIVRFHQIGGPEVLELDELPLPEPSAGEVRLRVKAIGLNRAEVMFREGKYLVSPALPSKLGYEASGTIEAIGSGVDKSWLDIVGVLLLRGRWAEAGDAAMYGSGVWSAAVQCVFWREVGTE